MCILEIRNENIGVPGGLFDPPTFQHTISKEVLQDQEQILFKIIFVENSFETSSSPYQPLTEDEDRLKG